MHFANFIRNGIWVSVTLYTYAKIDVSTILSHLFENNLFS